MRVSLERVPHRSAFWQGQVIYQSDKIPLTRIRTGMNDTCRPWSPGRTQWLPPSLVDWLTECHRVFVLLDLAAECNLEVINACFSQADVHSGAGPGMIQRFSMDSDLVGAAPSPAAVCCRSSPPAGHPLPTEIPSAKPVACCRRECGHLPSARFSASASLLAEAFRTGQL